MSVLSKTYFHDEAAAFSHLESVLWADGVACPHCGSVSGKHYDLRKTRMGLRKCSDCRKQFTVKVGTVFESAHIPLNMMLQAVYLMCSSKKGVSALQISRTLEITYKSAWFLCHRIREAMSTNAHLGDGGLGGVNKVVEIDETFVGGKAKNRAFKEVAPKKPVLTLVERDGRAVSFHVANVTGKTLRPIIVKNINQASAIMTDDSPVYPKIGAEFANHHAVNHSANEYARMGGYVHSNSVENYFSIFKRGVTGVYHSVSEAHLHRYLAEFDFRYSNRSGLGVEDAARARKALSGSIGKRLLYRDSFTM